MTLQATLLETAAGEMTESLKTQWFEALLRQDMAYYDINDVSGTATIIGTNGKKFRKGLGRKMGESVQFLITMLGGLVFGFWCSWRVSLLVLTIVPFMALSTAFLLKMNQTQTARANTSYAKAGGIVYMAVSSIRTILALNAVESVIDTFMDATKEAYEGAASQVLWLGLANGTVMGSFLLSYFPVSLYGSYLLYEQVRNDGCDPSGSVDGTIECDPGAFGVFGALMGITFAGAVLPQVLACVEAFTGARSACYPALMVIHRKTTTSGDQMGPEKELEEKSNALVRRGSAAPLPKYVIDSSSDAGLKPKEVSGDIQLSKVTFCYPTRQEVNVFDGLTLDIKAGQTVALCGPSGGGKSTTVQLIERFYDPSAGSITLDGTDLKELNVKWLRSQIGLVSQEPKLFAMSIRDNIKIGCPNATQEEMEEASRKANAHDFISAFAHGYDTQVGDEGAQLSGGTSINIMMRHAQQLEVDVVTGEVLFIPVSCLHYLYRSKAAHCHRSSAHQEAQDPFARRGHKVRLSDPIYSFVRATLSSFTIFMVLLQCFG
jgi:ATP-binding cassette subfamily B (MDR/TAP) protein 1